jgi:hypothetical protein
MRVENPQRHEPPRLTSPEAAPLPDEMLCPTGLQEPEGKADTEEFPQ